MNSVLSMIKKKSLNTAMKYT